MRGITQPSRRSRDIAGALWNPREWGALNGSNNNNPTAAAARRRSRTPHQRPPAALTRLTCRYTKGCRWPLRWSDLNTLHTSAPKGTRCFSLLATTTIKLNQEFARQHLRVHDYRGNGGRKWMRDGFRAMRRGAHACGPLSSHTSAALTRRCRPKLRKSAFQSCGKTRKT